MSYNIKPLSGGPFALLTRSSHNGSIPMVNWDQSTEGWVTASNTWSGDAMIFGVPAALVTTSSGVASVGFTISGSNYNEYCQQYAGAGTAKSKSDDQMVAYGSNASFSAINVAGGSLYTDKDRARCTVMRVVL